MKNNLLELGGSADLIAVAICDFQTPTRSFVKGEKVLSFSDIYFNFGYTTHENTSISKVTELAYNDYYLSRLNSNFVPLTDQIFALMSSDVKSNATVYENEILQAFAQSVILLYKPIEDTIVVSGVPSFEIIESNGIYILKSEYFENGKTYDVIYQREIECNVVSIESLDANIPYLELQLTIHGNINKENSTQYLRIPKAKLSFSPIIGAGSKDQISSCNISFTVIDALKSKPVALLERYGNKN